MHKIIVSGAIGMGLLLSGITALAQTGGTASGTPRENYRDKMQDKRAEMKERMEEKRGEMKEMRMERREDIIRNHFRRVLHRLDAGVERLMKLSMRIESRITKLEAEGVDVSKAKTSLADAKVKIEAAKTAVANAKTVVEGILAALPTEMGTTTPNPVASSLKQARESIGKAIEALKAAHKALVVTITEIKKGKNMMKKATTTPVI
ncbi:hypothetical protein L0Y69_00050 [bacterium]|nr:hypothetical protein [bacterium]